MNNINKFKQKAYSIQDSINIYFLSKSNNKPYYSKNYDIICHEFKVILLK